MADGQVVFEIVGDSKGINQTVKQVTNNIQSESRKWDDAVDESTQKAGKSFLNWKTVAVGAVTAIGAALINLGKASIESASNLKEVQNVVDTVFGDGAGQIDKWAKNAIKQFGLTETQAKKFTSTLGAMAKSSGVASDDIVTMSTDLAGLAADMASFYNLDFETAFEKIRSGISGETMPLKQLGINMSVANLEAFALAQGLEKTFSEMSQGEQTMLRYQYIMSATADAQGDFADTSDGYANSLRLLESQIETLKTNLGTPFLNVVEKATGFLNNLVNSMIPDEGEETYLDKVAKIDIDKDTKIKEINDVAFAAQSLLADMREISNNQDVATVVGNLAKNANLLKSDSKTNWESILKSLTGIDGLQNLFGDNETAVQNISDLALALSGNSPTMTQAKAWETLLNAMSSNLDAVASLTGQQAEGAAEWLQSLADSANDIEPGDVEAWNQLMGILLQGIDTESDKGQQFIDALVENFLAMGAGSEEAVAGLSALGFTTDEISQKQATWLAYCKELVKTIPGLSSLIDANTGEIEGGLPALEDYVDQWKNLSEYQAKIEAIRAKRQVYEEMTDPYTLEAEQNLRKSAATARLVLTGMDEEEAIKQLDLLEEIIRKYIEAGLTYDQILQLAIDAKTLAGNDIDAVSSATMYPAVASYAGVNPSDLDFFNKLTGKAEEAMLEYAQATYTAIQTERERPLVLKSLTDSEEELAAETGKTVDELLNETEAAAEAEVQLTRLQKATSGDAQAQKELEAAYKKTSSAIQAVADYYKQVRDSTEQAVNSTLKGFEKISTAYDDLNKKSNELAENETEVLNQYSAVWNKWGSDNEALKAMKAFGDAGGKLTDTEREAYEALVKVRNAQNEVNESVKQYQPEGMKENLQSQIQFMEEYLNNLAQLKEWGVSDEMISQLSDGTKESAAYLQGLVSGGKEEAQQVGEMFDEVAAKKQQFTDTLTNTKIKTDETFDDLVNTAIEAIKELDLYDEAKESLKQTVQGIADGIGEQLPEVTSAVDAIIEQLDRLNKYGMEFNILGAIGNLFTWFTYPGSYETGLDYVPRDNFPAFLHEGEGILTKEENAVWQSFKNSRPASVDYDALGGIMRDNVKAGGDVYLDGRTVGQVISGIQGRNYRNLQRSGWQG